MQKIHLLEFHRSRDKTNQLKKQQEVKKQPEDYKNLLEGQKERSPNESKLLKRHTEELAEPPPKFTKLASCCS